MAQQDQVSSRTAGHVPRPTSFHQILIILVGSMFLGGGSGDSLADRVEDAVAKGPRRDQAIQVVERLQAHSEAEVQRFLDWHRSFYKLVGEQSRTEGEVRASVEELVDTINRFDRGSVDMMFELRGALEESEWNEVFSD